MQHRIVDRCAEHLAKRAGTERRVIVDVARLCPVISDHLMRQLVELEKVYPDVGTSHQRRQHLGDEPPSRSHLLDLGRRSILDHPEIVPYAAIALEKLGVNSMCPELVEGHSIAGFDKLSPQSTGNGVLVLADLGNLGPGWAARVEDIVEPFLGEPSSELKTDHALAEG
jgi:hypothetical protein